MKLSTLVPFTLLAAVGLLIGACADRESTVGMHPEAHTLVSGVHADSARRADESRECKHAPCAGDAT